MRPFVDLLKERLQALCGSGTDRLSVFVTPAYDRHYLDSVQAGGQSV